MEIYVKETREIRNISLKEWDGEQWSCDMAADIMGDMRKGAWTIPGSDAAVLSAAAFANALDWWQAEVDAYNHRKRSCLMASEYDYLTDDDIADYYANRPTDSAYSLDDDLVETLTDADVREIIADTDFRGLLAFAGLTQTSCSKRFDIPRRTIQNWCSAGNERRECALYIRLMIAECMGLIGPER